jgi:hypothetical protein
MSHAFCFVKDGTYYVYEVLSHRIMVVAYSYYVVG